jgi:hypothetical protein
MEIPIILGALLDALAHGLERLPHIALPQLPRMADFALFAAACETAFWAPGTFWSAYSGNLEDAVDVVLEADPVATALRSLMASKPQWSGTATALLREMAAQAGDVVTRTKEWPKSARGLSGKLRRAAPFLRKIGINIQFDEREKTQKRTRTIHITTSAPGGAPEKARTEPSTVQAVQNTRRSGR